MLDSLIWKKHVAVDEGGHSQKRLKYFSEIWGISRGTVFSNLKTALVEL
jgi:hypothetical protein